MFAAFRGAMPSKVEGITVAFGNDGYEKDQRSKDEVATVRRFLTDIGINELGFATSLEDSSWAMLVWSDFRWLERCGLVRVAGYRRKPEGLRFLGGG